MGSCTKTSTTCMPQANESAPPSHGGDQTRVLPEVRHGRLSAAPEEAARAQAAQTCHDVPGEPEGHALRHPQLLAAVEGDAEVDVDQLPRARRE